MNHVLNFFHWCGKPLARAKAAVEKKDKIVEREMKKLTQNPVRKDRKFRRAPNAKGAAPAPAPAAK